MRQEGDLCGFVQWIEGISVTELNALIRRLEGRLGVCADNDFYSAKGSDMTWRVPVVSPVLQQAYYAQPKAVRRYWR